MFKNKSNFILVAIVILAFFLRLYKINGPIADWHSWRQADTSAVSRNFVKYGIDLLHPRFDDLSNIPSGKENPEGYRFVEFPLYNAIVAVKYGFLPVFSVEVWGRLVTIFFSLATVIFLYLLSSKYYGKKAGIFTAFFFAVLPYNVFYGRSILPDPQLVFATTGAIYFFDKWLEKEKIMFWFMAVVFFAAGLLFKTYAVFLLPVFIYLSWNKYKAKLLINPLTISFIIISFIPIVLWRIWILQFPEGIPAYDWLFNSDGIRLRPAFFRWILYERLTKLILGYGGIIFLVAGLFKKKNESWLFYVWAACIGLYVTVVATGNVRHDYYQIFAIPIVCIFLGKGVDSLLKSMGGKLSFKYVLRVTCVVLLVLLSLRQSWQTIRTYYWINNPAIVETGKAVDELVPNDAKVIAPYGGDTAFLYQTNRQGWPQGFEIEKKIAMGAGYYVNINLPDPETRYVMGKWEVVRKTDKYVIVKLK